MRRIPATRRTLRLESASIVAPGVRLLELATLDGMPFDHLAGQWVKLYLPGGIDRDYSIASAPGARGADRIELLVTRVDGGPGSGALHEMPIGTEIASLGPSGLFVREDDAATLPSLFVGTGSGVAPLRAMLQAMQAPMAESVLLFGCRTEADLMFADEWRARAASAPFRFEPTLSRGSASWTGRRGYVQTHLRELLPTLPSTTHVYVCGLTKMITEVRRTLKDELGVDRRRVHSERYD
jgi:ferredoxin-NADP reductase